MKKLLLSIGLIGALTNSNAQNCSELFFSEYVEGANNNKALEIYNPTPNPITINNDYRIVRYNNGSSATTAEALSQAMVILGQHTIQPYDVWVLVIDKRNAAGTGAEIPVDVNLQAVADTFVCPDYNTSYALYHNGNDALSLQKNVAGNWVYADIIGEIGVDPGASWSDCPPLYDATCGAYYTKDQTLIRKPTVEKGVSLNPSPFIAPLEWDSLPNNTFNQLGSHTCNCSLIGVKEVTKLSSIKVFPNPSNSGIISVLSADKKIASIEVYNVIGEVAKKVQFTSSLINQNVNLGLESGIYMMNVTFEDKTTASQKLIIE